MILLFSLTTCFGQWTQLNNAPFVNHHSNGFGVNGKGYIVQGFPTNNGGQMQNLLWEYDPQSDNWTSLGYVPGPDREFSIGDDMNDKYYFGFGIGRNDVWEYDPATNEFTELPSCPCIPRAHPGFVAHNDKIYMGAGSNNGNLDDWWVFDFATQEWSQKDDIPGPARHHPFQFGIDDGIYVGGGHVSSWFKFDINTETWSVIDDFPQGRVAGTQFSYDGKGFVLTGDASDHSELTDDHFLMYDPEQDEWFNLPFEQVMHRWAPSSFIIDEFLYFFGGFGADINGNDFHMWKFDLSSIACQAPDISYTASLTETSVNLIWGTSPTGPADTLQWRVIDSPMWNTILDPQSGYLLDNLESCTTYEFRINSSCESGSAFTDPVSFRTKGCGNCLDLVYCDVSDEYLSFTNYINRVNINAYENESGDNSGYEEFTSSSNVEIALGSTFSLEVEPGFDFSEIPYKCKVWMDLNADGEFGFSEMVLNASNLTGTLIEDVVVPTNGIVGPTRMRIVMDVNNLLEACNGSGDGEVEDYCISLIDELISVEDVLENHSDISISPNPSSGILSIHNSNNDSFAISVYDVSGKLLLSEYNPSIINLEDFQDGLYFIKTENKTTQEQTVEKLVLKK